MNAAHSSTPGALPASTPRSRLVSAALLVGALTLVTVSQWGCVAAAITGAAVGAMSAHDRRTLGAQTDDGAIEVKSPQRLLQAIRNSTAVNVVSFNRRVLLTGQVLDEAEKKAAGDAIARLDNVRAVDNELTVGPGVSLSRQAADHYVSTRVKVSLIEIGGVDANHVKVVTEDGVVYLMGLVTRAEADRAATVAARAPGVRKVVTLWELISERDAFRPEPSPAPWSTPGAGK